MKYKYIVAGIALLVMLVFLGTTNTNLFQGLLKGPGKDSALQSSLTEIETKLADYKQKIKISTGLEKEQISHTMAHERLSDKIVYTKKMMNLTQLLKDLTKKINNLDQLIKTTKFEKNSNSYTLINNLISSLRANIEILSEIQKQSNFNFAAERIHLMRDEAIKLILQLYKQSLTKEIKGVLADLKKFLQFEMPYSPEYESKMSFSTKIVRPGIVRNEATQVKIAVCLMRWNSVDAVINTENLIPIMDEVGSYFYEISYGKAELNVQYAGNTVWNGPLPDSGSAELAAAIEVCDSYIDFTEIDVLTIYPSIVAREGTAGVASPGKIQSITSDGEAVFGVNWLFDFNSRVIKHELGHTAFISFLPHANSYECGDNVLSEDGCQSVEYGNIYDVMGGSGLGGHFSGWHKKILGWAESIMVRNDGNYIVDALETASSGPKSLRILYAEHPICIEYRKPIGYDDFESKIGGSGYDTLLNAMILPDDGCLLISRCPMSVQAGSDYLLDTTPSSNVSDVHFDVADSCVNEGSELLIDFLDTIISFTQIINGSANVNIDIDENRVVILPNLSGQIATYDACTFSAPVNVDIWNSSELEITRAFDVKLVGISEDGSETILQEKTLPNMPVAGVTHAFTYNGDMSMSQFVRLKLIIDGPDDVAETDENDNTLEILQNCFI